LTKEKKEAKIKKKEIDSEEAKRLEMEDLEKFLEIADQEDQKLLAKIAANKGKNNQK